MNLLEELELIKKENELLLKQNDDFELINRATTIGGFISGLLIGILIGFLF